MPAMERESVDNRIGVIDGLRGWAALCIVACHVYFFPRTLRWYHPHPLAFGFHLAPLGYLINLSEAVTLFFVLSGFVLTLPYIDGRRSMESMGDVWIFIKRRARRLLPLYFFGFLWFATFTTYDTDVWVTVERILQMSTLTRHFIYPFSGTPYNGVLWSLEVEWWCSMVLPFCLLLLRRFPINRIVASAVLISFFSRLWLTYGFIPGETLKDYLVLNNVFTRLDAFAIGMAVAWMFAMTKEKAHTHRRLIFLGGIFTLMFGGLLQQFVYNNDLPFFMASLSSGLITIGFGLSVLGLLLIRHILIRIFLENRPIRLIGRMCYSLYVWHLPAIGPLQPLLNIAHFIRYIILVFSTSLLSYRYIECNQATSWKDVLPQKKKTH